MAAGSVASVPLSAALPPPSPRATACGTRRSSQRPRRGRGVGTRGADAEGGAGSERLSPRPPGVEVGG